MTPASLAGTVGSKKSVEALVGKFSQPGAFSSMAVPTAQLAKEKPTTRKRKATPWEERQNAVYTITTKNGLNQAEYQRLVESYLYIHRKTDAGQRISPIASKAEAPAYQVTQDAINRAMRMSKTPEGRAKMAAEVAEFRAQRQRQAVTFHAKRPTAVDASEAAADAARARQAEGAASREQFYREQTGPGIAMSQAIEPAERFINEKMAPIVEALAKGSIAGNPVLGPLAKMFPGLAEGYAEMGKGGPGPIAMSIPRGLVDVASLIDPKSEMPADKRMQFALGAVINLGLPIIGAKATASQWDDFIAGASKMFTPKQIKIAASPRLSNAQRLQARAATAEAPMAAAAQTARFTPTELPGYSAGTTPDLVAMARARQAPEPVAQPVQAPRPVEPPVTPARAPENAPILIKQTKVAPTGKGRTELARLSQNAPEGKVAVYMPYGPNGRGLYYVDKPEVAAAPSPKPKTTKRKLDAGEQIDILKSPRLRAQAETAVSLVSAKPKAIPTKAEWDSTAAQIRAEMEAEVSKAEDAAARKWTTNYSKMESDLKKKISGLQDRLWKSSGASAIPIKKDLDAAVAKLKEVQDGKSQADKAWDARNEAAKSVYAAYRKRHPELGDYEEFILAQAKLGAEIPDSVLVGSKLEGGLRRKLLSSDDIEALRERNAGKSGINDVNDANAIFWNNRVANALGIPERKIDTKSITAPRTAPEAPVQAPEATPGSRMAETPAQAATQAAGRTRALQVADAPEGWDIQEKRYGADVRDDLKRLPKKFHRGDQAESLNATAAQAVAANEPRYMIASQGGFRIIKENPSSLNQSFFEVVPDADGFTIRRHKRVYPEGAPIPPRQETQAVPAPVPDELRARIASIKALLAAAREERAQWQIKNASKEFAAWRIKSHRATLKNKIDALARELSQLEQQLKDVSPARKRANATPASLSFPRNVSYAYSRDKMVLAKLEDGGHMAYPAINLNPRTEAAIGGKVALIPGETQRLVVIDQSGNATIIAQGKDVDAIQAIKSQVSTPAPVSTTGKAAEAGNTANTRRIDAFKKKYGVTVGDNVRVTTEDGTVIEGLLEHNPKRVRQGTEWTVGGEPIAPRTRLKVEPLAPKPLSQTSPYLETPRDRMETAKQSSVSSMSEPAVATPATPPRAQPKSYSKTDVVYSDENVSFTADELLKAPLAVREILWNKDKTSKAVSAFNKWLYKAKGNAPITGKEGIEAIGNAIEKHGFMSAADALPPVRAKHQATTIDPLKVGEIDGKPAWTDRGQLVLGPPPKGAPVGENQLPNMKIVWDAAVKQNVSPARIIATRQTATRTIVYLENANGEVAAFDAALMKSIDSAHPGSTWHFNPAQGRMITAVAKKDGKPVAILAQIDDSRFYGRAKGFSQETVSAPSAPPVSPKVETPAISEPPQPAKGVEGLAEAKVSQLEAREAELLKKIKSSQKGIKGKQAGMTLLPGDEIELFLIRAAKMAYKLAVPIEDAIRRLLKSEARDADDLAEIVKALPGFSKAFEIDDLPKALRPLSEADVARSPATVEGATGSATRLLDESRAERGKAPLPTRGLTDREMEFIANNNPNKIDAREAAERAIATDTAPTVEELLVMRRPHQEAKNKFYAAMEAGDTEEVKRLENLLDLYEKAGKIAGSKGYHAYGRAAQYVVAPDFSRAALRPRAKYLNNGEDVTPRMKAALDELGRKWEESQAALGRATSQYEEEIKRLQKEIEKLKKEKSDRAPGAERAARTRSYLTILQKHGWNVVGETNAGRVGGRASKKSGAASIPFDPKEAAAIKKAIRGLARDAIEDGAKSLDEILAHIKTKAPDATDDVLLSLLSDSYSRALVDANVARGRTMSMMNRIKEQAAIRKLNIPAKVLVQGWDILNNTQRSLMASIDASFAMIQGGKALQGGFYKEWLNSWKPALRAGLSKAGEAGDVIEAELQVRAHFAKSVKAGVQYTDMHGISSEEMFGSKTAEKIPGVARSNAAFNAFMNNLRYEMFSTLMARQTRKGRVVDEAYAKDAANLINVLTGRGMGKASGIAGKLGDVFFAPKFMLSEAQDQALVPLLTAKTKAGRTQALRAYATRAATLVSLAYWADQIPGVDVDWDPRSDTNGYVRLPNGVIVDFWNKQSALTRVFVQIAAGRIKRDGGYYPFNPSVSGTADDLWRFAKNRFSPGAATIAKLADRSRYDFSEGERRLLTDDLKGLVDTAKDIIDNPTPAKIGMAGAAAGLSVAPLAVRDIVEIGNEKGPIDAVMAAPFILGGLRLGTTKRPTLDSRAQGIFKQKDQGIKGISEQGIRAFEPDVEGIRRIIKGIGNPEAQKKLKGKKPQVKKK